MTTVLDVAKDVLENSLFWTDEHCPFKASLEPNDPRLLVIGGANATGKSLMFQFIAAVARAEHAYVPVSISIRERTGAGTFEMANLRRTFMFGDESEQSTGATSARVLESGFNNVLKRDDKKEALLLLDEPELGLSDDYAHALGTYVAQKTIEAFNTEEGTCRGVVVVTHNRAVVQGLMQAGLTPSFMSMGEALTLSDWLAFRNVKSVEDFLALSELDHTQYRQTKDLFRALSAR